MNRLHSILIALALGTVPVVGAITCSLAWQAKQDEHNLALQAGGVLTGISRPCKGPKGPDACGTLAQINKSVIDIGNITVTAQMQVSQTATLVAQYGNILNGIANDIHGEMAEAQKTTAALTGTAQQATATIATADGLIKAEKPRVDDLLRHSDLVLESGNQAVDQLSVTLANPDLKRILANSASMTDSGQKILADAKFEADKFAHPTKKKLTFWGGVMAGVEVIHKIEPPIF